MSDAFAHHAASLTSPPARLSAVTPSDSQDLPLATRGLMVAAAGDVSVVTVAGDEAVLPGLQPGVQYAVRCRRIKATGTTATGILAMA